MCTLKYFCCLVGAGLLLTGCSLLKKNQATVYNASDTGQAVPQRERPLESELSVMAPPETDQKSGRKRETQRTEEQVSTPPVERPKITFTATESADVRLPFNLNNPFPSSGNLVFPLEELAEEFRYPYEGKFLSPFGMRGRSMHTGVDIKTVPNDTIRAAWPGVVRMAKNYSGYGNIVVIRHYNGMETAYAHHTKNLVAVNDVVEAGDPIGLAGRTGRATTEHLHFEVRVGSEPLDPSLFIDPTACTLRKGNIYVYSREGLILAYNENKDDEIAAIAAARKRPSTQNTIVVNAPGGGEAKYHIIKSGDTLSAIARKYSTTVNKLCELNNIKATQILRINQRLRVS